MSPGMGSGYIFSKKRKPAFRNSNNSETDGRFLDGRRTKGFQSDENARTGRRNVVDPVLSDDKFDNRFNGGMRNVKLSLKKPQFRSPERYQAEIHGKTEFGPCQKKIAIYANREERWQALGFGKPSDFELMGSVDMGKNYSSTIHAKSKFKSSKHLDQSLKNSLDASLAKSTKKAAWHKKDLADGSVAMDDKPRKVKLVMQIDPHDITNKRLVDSMYIDGITQKKSEDSEKRESNNAQFRAIQPSPSIQSFVEDNLLGRRRLIEFKRAGYNTDLSAPLDNIPQSENPERERIEEPMFRNRLAFFAAANVASSFPPPELPEIAFGGRSNVGKSSLLNALTRHWGLARTSDKPGLTQTINFFKLGSKLCLVDLPGYGFAYAKEEVKDSWQELVKEYVSTRVGLRQVCLLIDTKWGMKARDFEIINLMERSKTKYQIVLTKTDTMFPMDVARRAMQIEERLKANKSAVQPLMMVSSKTGAGIQCLRTALSMIARRGKV